MNLWRNGTPFQRVTVVLFLLSSALWIATSVAGDESGFSLALATGLLALFAHRKRLF